MFALLGVGLGALLRDQVGAVVGLLVHLFVGEPIVTRIPALQDWTVYLPGPSASALTQITLIDQDFLQPWQGGVVLAVYAMAAGLWHTRRVDLTRSQHWAVAYEPSAQPLARTAGLCGEWWSVDR